MIYHWFIKDECCPELQVRFLFQQDSRNLLVSKSAMLFVVVDGLHGQMFAIPTLVVTVMIFIAGHAHIPT